MRSVILGLVAVSFLGIGCSSPSEGTTNPRPKSSSGTIDDDTPATPPIQDTTPPENPGTTPAPGTSVGTETWADGKQISANVTISEGATVTIAPGAKITVASGVSITVVGTLKATTNATHASLSAPSGATWGGLVIAKNGTLAADSLDLIGAGKAIWTQPGGTATFDNGIINATQPFNMEAGSTLSTTKSTVTAKSESALAGTFTASHLTYDKGSAEGLYINDAAAKVTITDSMLKGLAGGD